MDKTTRVLSCTEPLQRIHRKGNNFMKKQRSIAIVNDISGFGRCSITVALPILSAMKIQCGILPTAILSNHTEYPEYTFFDFTDYMDEYLKKWKNLRFQFDGIYTGYLGSKDQISIIKNMLTAFSFEKIIVDPVMGDNGSLYPAYTLEMCNALKQLVTCATVTTPNLTELCILTDTPYRIDFTENEILEMCKKLHSHGPKQIIVTGIKKGAQIGNAIYNNETFEILYHRQILPLRPGTGDVFASIIAGESLHNTSLRDAVQKATSFIQHCLTTSSDMDIPLNDGVCFEEHLHMLMSGR